MQALHGIPLASFKSRASAFIVDFLIVFGLFLGLLFAGAALARRLGYVFSENAVVPFDFKHWYSLLLIVVYFALATYWGNGKTPGKWIFGIRVVSLGRERITLWQSFERALGYGASMLEAGFGFLQYFMNVNRRTVHDRIAETIVIKDRIQKAPHQ